MSILPLAYRPSAVIQTFEDDSFQEDPAGFDALLVACRDQIDEIIDIVAWRMGTDRPWWRHRKIADALGYKALWEARWPHLGYPIADPCLMLYETPKAWLATISPNAVCILDWSTSLPDLFVGIDCPIYCETKTLREHFETKLDAGKNCGLRELLRGFE